MLWQNEKFNPKPSDLKLNEIYLDVGRFQRQQNACKLDDVVVAWRL